MSFVRAPTAVVAAMLAGLCAFLLLALTLLTTGSATRIDTPDIVRPTLEADRGRFNARRRRQRLRSQRGPFYP